MCVCVCVLEIKIRVGSDVGQLFPGWRLACSLIKTCVNLSPIASSYLFYVMSIWGGRGGYVLFSTHINSIGNYNIGT